MPKIHYSACSRCCKSVDTEIETVTTKKWEKSRIDEDLFKNKFHKAWITIPTKDPDDSRYNDYYLLCKECWLDFVNRWLKDKS